VFAALSLTCLLLIAGGCALGQLVGGMAESARRAGSHEVSAKYSGLSDKTFAVIVAADRSIQADFPSLVSVTTREVTKLLSENTGAKGVLPADEVLKFQSQHPNWVAMPFDKLASELAVDRLVYIEVQEFALHDPGNIYVYNGVAAGQVHVIEADSQSSAEFAFNEPVRVKFPDVTGMGTNDMGRRDVLGELARRFIARSAWMFYHHEEPNVMKY